jgi:hypothetical protein
MQKTDRISVAGQRWPAGSAFVLRDGAVRRRNVIRVRGGLARVDRRAIV